MQIIDLIGLIAAAFVLLTFYATDLGSLRRFAIASNLLFIVYALSLQLWPICILHCLLLPLNLQRLSEVSGNESQPVDRHALEERHLRNLRLATHPLRQPWHP
ncbi:MAG: hypothetical protein AAF678_06140 [Pseudomonadota bacterium]